VSPNNYTRHQTPGQWPKSLPSLTEEQRRIREDFYRVWLEELPRRFNIIERINYRYAAHSANDFAGEQ